MLATLSSIVVAAAFIPGAEAGLKASSHAGPDGVVIRTPPVHSSSHTTSVSKVTCSSKARSKSASYAVSAFVDAMAGAVAYGCSQDLDDDWRVMVDHMTDSKTAFAWAYAEASAEAGCVSEGNAYGCASAYANAKAWAKALIKVYASAWASAVNVCECNGKYQVASVYDHGSAYEFDKLITKVEAEASAYVCVSGDDSDFASTTSRCYHSIYATGFAKAWAKALIDGGCYYYSGDLEAEAKIHALAKIDKWEYIWC